MEEAIKFFILICVIIVNGKVTAQNNSLSCQLDSNGVAKKVDIEAKFVGGEKEVIKYLNKVDLSEVEFEKSKIKICLIIDTLGNVVPFKINGKLVSSLNLTPFEQRYCQALKDMPNWKPASCNNRSVNSYFYLTHYIDVR